MRRKVLWEDEQVPATRPEGHFGFSASAAVIDLLMHHDQDDPGYRYTFNGDLCQMATQEDFLRRAGFDIGHLDVYPAVRTEEEFNEAITLIWRHKASGWWHYKDKLVALKVCTAEEFQGRLLAPEALSN